jgi:hypothetical protein
MNIAVLILVCAIALGIPLSFLLFPRSRFPRVLAALVLIGLALFGIFGFMASYEYSEPAKRLPWQVGYGVLCLACLSGAVMLLRSRGSSKAPTSTDASR